MDDTKRIFAENLRKLLDIKGISQTEFAKKIGVKKQTVSCWCRGVTFPNTDTLEKISAYFGVDPSAMVSFLETDHRMPAHLMEYIRQLNNAGLIKLEERVLELLALQDMKKDQ